jgi:4-amino-4-deoxy-L-arabinose transferase-like glycosyltransferase
MTPTTGRKPLLSQAGLTWRQVLAILAGCMAVVAFLLMLTAGESALVRWLWAGGMILLVVSQLRLPTMHVELRPLLPLLAILAIAAVMRFYRLGDIPDFFHGDIASWGLEARAFLEGRSTHLFTTGWSDWPALTYWTTAQIMRVFGDSMAGLSASAAVHGLLSILGVYLLAQELFDRRVGWVAAALLTISYTHLHFSRIAGSIAPLTFVAFTLYFLARGLRRGGSASFVLAGICLGLGMQDYGPARMALVVLAATVPWLFLWQRDVFRRSVGGLGWMALGFFVAFGPMLAFALKSPEAMMGRGNLVTLLNPTVVEHLKEKYQVDTMREVVLENAKRSALMFSVYGDSSTHFSLPRPIVDPLTAALLVMGVGIALRRLKEARSMLLLSWLAGTMILGSALLNDPPFWPHLTVLLPAVAILAAVALDRLWQAATDALDDLGDRLAQVLIVGALLYMGLQNVVLYYDHVRDNATPVVSVARFVDRTDPRVEIVLVTDPFSLREREIAFMAKGHLVREVDEQTLVDGTAPLPASAIYLITPNHQRALEALQARHPDASAASIRGENGEIHAYVLRVGGAGAVTAGEAPSAGASLSPVRPDANQFPAQGTRFTGNTNSSLWDIDFGTVDVRDGQLTVRIAQVPGYGAVVDNLRLVAPDGSELLFQAEDPAVTSGDPAYASREGADGHWWLQQFEPFSGGAGLVAQAGEGAPVLTMVLTAPDGAYRLHIGSFTGDKDNGVFALDVATVSDP